MGFLSFDLIRDLYHLVITPVIDKGRGASGSIRINFELNFIGSKSYFVKMASQVRVVVALCFEGLNNFLIIPECPYCYCRHSHRCPGLKPLSTRHRNGELIPYTPDMATKISDCQTTAHTYALELRDKKDVPVEKIKLCRGVTAKNKPCKCKSNPGYCVCKIHFKQMQSIADKRLVLLYGS